MNCPKCQFEFKVSELQEARIISSCSDFAIASPLYFLAWETLIIWPDIAAQCFELPCQKRPMETCAPTSKKARLKQRTDSRGKNLEIDTYTSHNQSEPQDGTQPFSFYALPSHLGGLNIVNPTASTCGYFGSIDLYNPINNHDPIHAELFQNRFKKDIKMAWNKEEKTKPDILKKALNQQTKYFLELTSQKGPSSWINGLPLKKNSPCGNSSPSRMPPGVQKAGTLRFAITKSGTRSRVLWTRLVIKSRYSQSFTRCKEILSQQSHKHWWPRSTKHQTRFYRLDFFRCQ